MPSAEPTEVAPQPPPASSTPLPPHPDFFPFHLAPGISNFRDIGGWPIASAEEGSTIIGHVRRGVLYRGSDTNRVQPEGVKKLVELGIKTDFDLRSKQQIEKTGGFRDLAGEGFGIQRRWTPVFSDEAYTDEEARRRYELYAGDGTEGIVEAFVEILKAGGPMFRTVITQLLETVPPPSSSDSDAKPPALFMHCTTGNNRTGVFIALLLLLLRVPRSTIAHEYALSEQGLAPTRHIQVGRLLGKGAFKEHGEIEAKRKCERMIGAREESMWALLDEVDRRWGGAEGYFKQEVGLTEDQIKKLREILTVEEKT
ncbi:hypothetical protein NMY22_g1159 [Coprinellus aureogranulatus]|nr:hypothetical protein NMY22_g1159 [Coprinellus aureogranulatus]